MRRITILIVDDEDLLRLTLKSRLEKEGYSTTEAASVTEARKRLAEEPRLVLLDQRLPDGTGVEL
jgi:CheY-like chemotaxis protein